MTVIRQKSTPTHVFTLPFDTSIITEVEITYRQGGRIKVTKHRADCTFDGTHISVDLTQQETLAFEPLTDVDIQLVVVDNTGKVIPSNVLHVPVEEALSKTILEVPSSSDES